VPAPRAVVRRQVRRDRYPPPGPGGPRAWLGAGRVGGVVLRGLGIRQVLVVLRQQLAVGTGAVRP
jgi:hypothetical protein